MYNEKLGSKGNKLLQFVSKAMLCSVSTKYKMTNIDFTYEGLILTLHTYLLYSLECQVSKQFSWDVSDADTSDTEELHNMFLPSAGHLFVYNIPHNSA